MLVSCNKQVFLVGAYDSFNKTGRSLGQPYVSGRSWGGALSNIREFVKTKATLPYNRKLFLFSRQLYKFFFFYRRFFKLIRRKSRRNLSFFFKFLFGFSNSKFHKKFIYQLKRFYKVSNKVFKQILKKRDFLKFIDGLKFYRNIGFVVCFDLAKFFTITRDATSLFIPCLSFFNGSSLISYSDFLVGCSINQKTSSIVGALCYFSILTGRSKRLVRFVNGLGLEKLFLKQLQKQSLSFDKYTFLQLFLIYRELYLISKECKKLNLRRMTNSEFQDILSDLDSKGLLNINVVGFNLVPDFIIQSASLIKVNNYIISKWLSIKFKNFYINLVYTYCCRLKKPMITLITALFKVPKHLSKYFLITVKLNKLKRIIQKEKFMKIEYILKTKTLNLANYCKKFVKFIYLEKRCKKWFLKLIKQFNRPFQNRYNFKRKNKNRAFKIYK